MATTYPSSPTPLLNITEAHLWARAQFKKDIVSNFYKIPVLLHAIAALNNKKSFIPGEDTLIGASPFTIDTTKVGGAEYRWTIKSSANPNGKWMAENDTAPNASDSQQVNNFMNVGCGWAARVDPVSIPNATVVMEDGTPMLGAGAVEESMRDANSEHLDAIGTSLWTGAPSDSAKVRMTDLIGLETWINPSNTILGVDRSQAANAEFRGNKSTAALPASLALIDQIILQGVADGSAGTTIPIAQYGARSDLVMSTVDVYVKLKAEAQSKGFSIRDLTKPEANKYNLGFLDEHFMYNGRLFTFDPKWTGTGKLMVLDTSTIQFHMNPKKAFSTFPMVNLRSAVPNSGQRDVTTTEIETWSRLIVTSPKRNFFASAVS